MSLKVKTPGPNGAKNPPGGWTASIPELGKKFGPAINLGLIRGWVQKALKAAGKDPEVAEALIHRHTATRLKAAGHKEWVEEANAAVAPAAKRLGLLDYWKGAKAYARILSRKATKLPIFTIQAEAVRRAEICANCPKNIKPEDVKTPGWAETNARARMRGMVEGRSTPQDPKIGQCGVCLCENRVLVHLHADVLKPDMDNPQEYPPNCWKLKM